MKKSEFSQWELNQSICICTAVNSLMPIATTSCKQPPPVSDHFQSNSFVSQSNTFSKLFYKRPLLKFLGYCVICTPLSRYTSRHIDRHSTNVSVNISTEMPYDKIHKPWAIVHDLLCMLHYFVMHQE